MTNTDKKNIADIKAYVRSLEQLDQVAFQKNKHLITLCFDKAIQIIESNAQADYIASMEEIKERCPYATDNQSHT